MKNVTKWIIGIMALVLSYIVVVLIIGTLTDFQPDEVTVIKSEQEGQPGPIKDSIISIAIWNIGYAGLGEESDFFYDGAGMLFSAGSDVRPSKALSEKNYGGILQWIKTTKSDFFLLQEVDIRSRRSYRQNQFKGIAAQVPDYYAGFAVNYKSPWVPLPLFEPWNTYGKVFSGLATYSKYQPVSATRYQLPGSYGWPTRIFQLDRCAAVFRYPVDNGKELVIVNVHNSAFDKGGKLKKQQMEFLRKFFLAEYEKGNYLIAGGDWNQCPPYFRKDGFLPGSTMADELTNVEPSFMPEDWVWVYDPSMPTNRSVKEPFVPKETFVTVIDYFLISPNLRYRKIKGLNMNFRFSDHQPLWMQVELLD